MLQWNSRGTSHSWGQNKLSQDRGAYTEAFPGRAVSTRYSARFCHRCVYLSGVHSVTWLKNGTTAIVRSSIWRRTTPRKLQYNYCHPSFPDLPACEEEDTQRNASFGPEKIHSSQRPRKGIERLRKDVDWKRYWGIFGAEDDWQKGKQKNSCHSPD